MTRQSDNTCGRSLALTSRRDILRGTACGFGWLAFGALANKSMPAAGAAEAAGEPRKAGKTKAPHFEPRAKRVIFICMRGGPSHVDTFDYKPKLVADAGKAGRRPGTTLTAPIAKFAQRGKSGLWISDLFPNLAGRADDMCLIRSMQTDVPAHPQAFLRLHTGTSQFVRPSLGSWTLYGLGNEADDLPGFVTITPPSGFGGAQNYGAGFLPAANQGTRLGSDNRSVASAQIDNLKPRLPASAQRVELDYVQELNRHTPGGAAGAAGPEVEGVIESFELAFRMQGRMPEVLDTAKETKATREMYGIGDRATEDFGRKLLMARRLAESGVRFVEVTHGNWDHHFNLGTALPNSCNAVDKPLAGLLEDLRGRGMLKDTLVVWGGEFGRTPHAQGGDGRDHNNKAFTLWMAGGGTKGGFSYGDSGDYGYEATENPVSIHDLHATMLHLLGMDHEKLTFRYAGRDFRLTDVDGRAIKAIMA
jgi:hypothetical protein